MPGLEIAAHVVPEAVNVIAQTNGRNDAPKDVMRPAAVQVACAAKGHECFLTALKNQALGQDQGITGPGVAFGKQRTTGGIGGPGAC